jgi:heme-degrading monooxygenase HmoA
VIRHIVFFSARRDADVARIADGLRALSAIPGTDFLEVALNAKIDPISDEIDVVVYAEFKDEAALKEWKADPLYAETTKVVRPLRELRYSADFVSRREA